jgi:DNA-binding CsgD family transcriptional regulator/tetratricopeptide (TPR) repeat protein/nucleoside-triphosphatase THEP1
MEPHLVGRDEELRALSGWLDDASARRSQLVLLAGDAGMGKTRLTAALADQATAEGALVVWGRTTELDGAPPYWPWLQVLEQLDQPELLAPASATDPETERFGRFEAVAAALRRASADRRLVVILDDMHRADEASLRLLAHVGARVDDTAILIVVIHRSNLADQVPGFVAVIDELARRPSMHRIDLGGLPIDAVAALLDGAADPATVQEVAETSGGNPLFVGELARHLAAGGDLATVPRSIRDAVRLRLDRRSAWCAEVVRAAAVIGRIFPAGLIATAPGRPAMTCLEAIAEAEAAGLVEPNDRVGEFRFVHALVRDAVEASIPAPELPVLHRTIAEAIETYEGVGDAQVADLARHWDAASVLGDRATAAHWCERAAAVADRQLAWEEAARLYDRALELGDTDTDPLDTYARAFGAAQARLLCDDVTASIERCLVAADAARAADRPDLFAEATLVPEGRGGPELLRIWAVANEALESLPTDDHSRRARLHSHLATLAFYVEPDAMDHHVASAVREAAIAGDQLAEVTALRAQHTASLGPQHAASRLDLATRLGTAARAVGRPSVAIWEPLWRIDALIELGRIRDAVATVPALRRCVREIGAPMARWHLERVEAVLAQAVGRFADALDHAERARALFAAHEDALGAEAMYLGFRSGLEMHSGRTNETSARWDAIDLTKAPSFLGDLPLLGPAVAHLGVGRVDHSRALYSRLGPAEGWAAPKASNDAIWLHMYVVRIMLASKLGVLGDLPPLLGAVAGVRGTHVASGGGAVAYEGPVELWLGVGARALGDWDAADRELGSAVAIAQASGTPGFEVHARVERAATLLDRARPTDAAEARRMLEAARPMAQRLGMPEFVARIDELAENSPADTGPLSPRELEVAALVADGHTNKEIADSLFVSERTAQNHVQHILTKLGLSNRTQIAAWYGQRDR